MDGRYWSKLDLAKQRWWSLPRLAKRGDLIGFWHRSPRKELRHLAVITENATANAKWRWGGHIRIVARLEHSVTLDHIRQNAQLRRASFVRSNFQKRYDVTPWWADLYRLITTLNPEQRDELRRFFSI